MARTTISIPDELVKRLEPFKDELNVSEACRNALTARVDFLERIHEAISKENEMDGMIERLKAEKVELLDWVKDAGQIDGQEWALKYASYNDLLQLSEATPDNFDPDSLGDYVEQVQDHAREQGEIFDHEAYFTGFIEAATKIWEQAESKV